MRSLAQTACGPSSPRPRAPREHYQLHDFILIAVHRACDLREFDAARELLASAEWALKEHMPLPETRLRHALDALTAAHERLWILRHDADRLVSNIKAS